jgi:putative endonuclease
MQRYSVYLVECRDGSLYTGIATDVPRRMQEHEAGTRGAKYLRGKGPLRLVFAQPVGDRGLAQRVEARIKQLPKTDKANIESLPARIDELLVEFSGGQ